VKIVLVNPQIPQNTGNIARLSAASSCELHLIKPLGFELSDKYLKRAGLDYWKYVDWTVHESWEDYLNSDAGQEGKLWFFSTKAESSYLSVQYMENDSFVFGCETAGLAESFHQDYGDQRLSIKIDQPGVRSLNLANSVAIVVYEARRQLGTS